MTQTIVEGGDGCDGGGDLEGCVVVVVDGGGGAGVTKEERVVDVVVVEFGFTVVVVEGVKSNPRNSSSNAFRSSAFCVVINSFRISKNSRSLAKKFSAWSARARRAFTLA